jgi:hypothetical protein
VSDPTAPSVVAEDTDIEDSWALVVGAGVAYVGTSTFIAAFDVSDPANPTELSRYDDPDQSETFRQLALNGRILYAAATNGGLEVLDVADPTAIVRLDTIDFEEQEEVVAFGGERLVVGTRDELVWYDVTRPNVPVELGRAPLRETEAVTIVGTTAYVSVLAVGLRVLDITAGGSVVSDIPSLGEALDIDIVGSTAWVTDGSTALVALDISTPTMPARVGAAFVARPFCSVIEGDYAYVASIYLESAFDVVDISDRTNPVVVGTVPDFAYSVTPRELAKFGNYVYSDTDPMLVYDVSDPAAPVVAGEVAVRDRPGGIAVHGGNLYLPSDAGLTVFDLTNPAAPVELDHVQTSRPNDTIVFMGDYAFTGNNTSGMTAWNIATPSNLGIVSTTPVGLFVGHVALDGTTLYAQGRGDGPFRLPKVTILDVTDPANPVVTGELFSAVRTMEPYGDYLLGGQGGLSILQP